MTYVAVYFVVACVVASLLTYFALNRKVDTAGIESAQKLMNSLDIEAFRNLVNPEEEAFLQASLPADRFKAIKRERLWAAFAYTRALSGIALEFSRFGNALSQSPDAGMADLGKQLSGGAIQLRILALTASGRLFMAAAFPNLPHKSPRSLLEQYDRSAKLLTLCGLRERSRRSESRVSA